MKTKLISITVIFILVITSLCLISINADKKVDMNEVKGRQLVDLNEINNLVKQSDVDDNDKEIIADKISDIDSSIRNSKPQGNNKQSYIYIFTAICVVFCLCVILYVFIRVLRPFEKMKKYSENIARGNFDLPLKYERSDYFGEFTWAFDNMRREITKARFCEKEAIENNKTVIATLSHDIKTPIASIRAFSEALEANINGSEEKKDQYIEVIMKKCDEVAKLTNDLFIHSISDMDKLKMNTQRVKLCSLLEEVLFDMSDNRNDINYIKPMFECDVTLDKKRFAQSVENIINNARKYAKSKIDVTVIKNEDNAVITFKDYGKGIPDENIPFIFDKFYRGSNCGDEQGSGLGLYIVRYVMSQINAKVKLENKSDGLEVSLLFNIEK